MIHQKQLYPWNNYCCIITNTGYSLIALNVAFDPFDYIFLREINLLRKLNSSKLKGITLTLLHLFKHPQYQLQFSTFQYER